MLRAKRRPPGTKEIMKSFGQPFGLPFGFIFRVKDGEGISQA